jgi:hypothetical protein
VIKYIIRDYTDGKIWQHMSMGKINAIIIDTLSEFPERKNEIGFFTNCRLGNFNIGISKPSVDTYTCYIYIINKE